MEEEILIQEEYPLGIITLNRPKALNALTLSMIRILQAQLDAWLHHESIHAVIIQSSSEKAFCAGGDIRQVYRDGKNNDSNQLIFFKEEYHLNRTIHHYPKPYIALMDGITMGGGVGISLHGSHRVAGNGFIFAMPETSIGFFPDIGSSYLLSRCPGKLGIYLGLTGHRLNAEEAFSGHLIDYRVDSEQFSRIKLALHQMDLSQNAFSQVTTYLKSIAKPSSNQSIASLQENVDKTFHYQQVEDIFEALKQMNTDWSRATLRLLEGKSPLSLKVTLAQLNKAVHLDFENCMDMDERLVPHFLKTSDFYEGVRALLIDKDKTPHWNLETLAQISSSVVNRFFM